MSSSTPALIGKPSNGSRGIESSPMNDDVAERLRESLRLAVADELPLATTRPASIRLGIDELPAALESMSPGLLYGLSCDNPALQFAIAIRSLSRSAHERSPSVIVTTQDPARFLHKASILEPRLRRQVNERRVRILQLDADIERQLLQFGLPKLIVDLDAQQIAADSLVVIDHAELVLGLSDPGLARAANELLSAWASNRRLAVLLLVSHGEHQPRAQALLRTASRHWGGIAISDMSASGASIVFEHWTAMHGIATSRAFEIVSSADGSLRAKGSRSDTALPLSKLVPPSRLFATARALGSMRVPGIDTTLHDDARALVEAVRHHGSGLVLLDYTRFAEYERLTRLLPALQAVAAQPLQIVIRECGVRLRMTERAVLRQLGVNLIIGPEQSDASVQSLLGQICALGLTADQDGALTAAIPLPPLPQHSARHVSPQAFLGSVRRAIEGPCSLLPNTLIDLGARTSVGASTLGNRAAARLRDMQSTVIDDRLLLFLYGCTEDASPAVLRRILDRGEELGSSWTRSSSPQDIRLHLERAGLELL